jgi:hypothetical protein
MNTEKEIEESLKEMAKEMSSVQANTARIIAVADEKIKEIAGANYGKVKDLQERLIKAEINGDTEMAESLKSDLEKIIL